MWSNLLTELLNRCFYGTSSMRMSVIMLQNHSMMPFWSSSLNYGIKTTELVAKIHLSSAKAFKRFFFISQIVLSNVKNLWSEKIVFGVLYSVVLSPWLAQVVMPLKQFWHTCNNWYELMHHPYIILYIIWLLRVFYCYWIIDYRQYIK